MVASLDRKRLGADFWGGAGSAVHLIASGVDAAIVQNWMGHVSLDTTNIYAQANLETKRKAIEKADGVLRPHAAPRWKRNADVLDWLDSL